MNQLALKLTDYEIPESLKDLDPTNFSNWKFDSTTTPADIINTLIPIIFILAGIVLLAMLVSGGFTIFISAGNPEKIKKGTSMITSALVGFLIIFAAYWIIQLLELTFGINILGAPPVPPISFPPCTHGVCP